MKIRSLCFIACIAILVCNCLLCVFANKIIIIGIESAFFGYFMSGLFLKLDNKNNG